MADQHVVPYSENYNDDEWENGDSSLAQYLPVLRRRWFPSSLVFLCCLGLSTAASFMLAGTTYEVTGKLLFQGNDPKTELTGVGKELGKIDGSLANPLDTQATILTSRVLMDQVIDKIGILDEEGDLVDAESILTDLEVARVNQTAVLEIAYQSDNPQLAAQIVSELMQAYVSFFESVQRSEVSAAKAFVDEQLPRLSSEIERAASALEQFKDQNDIVVLNQEAAEIVTLSSDLSQQTNQVRTALQAANARSSQLREQLDVDVRQALRLSSLNDSTGVQEVLTQLYTVESELVTQQALYLPQHPTIVNLQGQAEALSGLLQERVSTVLNDSAQVPLRNLQVGTLQQTLMTDLVQVESERIALQTQLNVLREIQDDYRNRADDFPYLERTQFELDRDLRNAQERYDELLRRSREIELAEIQVDGSNQVQVIENPVVPESEVVLLNYKILVAGVGASLILAFALALMLDRLDPSLKTVDALEKQLGYPLLGVIPSFEAPQSRTLAPQFQGQQNFSSRIVAFNLNSHQVLQAYQGIYSSLRVANLKNIPRVLAVSSSVYGEGKSEISANLAASMAQSGQKVLLIDADLRTPTQQALWGIENVVGLSDILSDTSRLEESVHSITPNLSVVTAGSMAANPLLFFESPLLKELVQTASKNYDYIIFDTPPVVPVPDVLILGKAIQGLLFVAQPNRVHGKNIQAAKHILTQTNLPILGLVANQVDDNEVKSHVTPFSGEYYGSETKYSYRTVHETITAGAGVISPTKTQLTQNGKRP